MILLSFCILSEFSYLTARLWLWYAEKLRWENWSVKDIGLWVRMRKWALLVYMQISLVSNISHYYFNSLPVAPCSNNKIHCSNICLLVHPFTRPLIPSCRSLKKTLLRALLSELCRWNLWRYMGIFLMFNSLKNNQPAW